jgi:CheY-like chemotaxis protein
VKTYTVLIVEDEPLIAMMLEDFLESLGHQLAGTVDSVADALARVDEGGFDIAILDLHLKGGEEAWVVADRLSDANIPFVLATGGHIEPAPARHADAPVLAKPYTIDAVQPVLEEACKAKA